MLSRDFVEASPWECARFMCTCFFFILIAYWRDIPYIVIGVVAIYVFLAATYNIITVYLCCSCVFDRNIFSHAMLFSLTCCWCIVCLLDYATFVTCLLFCSDLLYIVGHFLVSLSVLCHIGCITYL